MPSRHRRQVELERVVGTPALFATAYGNVGSSIYYALGLTAVYALGLTPIVFIVAGLIFACTAATYSEGTVRYPEAGGSTSFARHAFDELVSFTAGWAQMLVYVVTVAVSAFFVPHYLAIFWEPLRTNPWDIVGGAIVILVLVALNVVGVSEAAKLSVTLAVIDLATQVLLVLVGIALVLSPERLVDNVHWGVAPTWSNLALAVPVAMLAYTGVETVSNLAEEVRDPVRSVPNAYKLVALAVFGDLLHPSVRRSLGLARRADRRRADDEAGAAAGGGRLRQRSRPRPGPEPGARGTDARRGQDLRRRPRRHDPLHRDERGRDRRLEDHLFDGELSPAARGLPPPPPALQDSVARHRRLRRDRTDRDPAPGRRQLRGHALLLRGDVLVHRGARFDHPAADAPGGGGRADRPSRPQPGHRRRRLAALRDRGRSGDGRLVPRHPRPERGDALDRDRLDRARVDRLCDLPPRRPPRAGAGDRAGAGRLRPGARARVPPAAGADSAWTGLRRCAGQGREPCCRARRADRRDHRTRGPARPAAGRRARCRRGGRESRARRGPRDRRLVRRRGDSPPGARPERRRGDRGGSYPPRDRVDRTRRAAEGARPPQARRFRRHRRLRAQARDLPRDGDRVERHPTRLYATAVLVLALVFVGIGIALLAVTAANGGGVLGFVLGGLFVALGVGRITLLRKDKG